MGVLLWRSGKENVLMKRIILAIVSVLALIFAIGSVGAYDHSNIGSWQLLIHVGIAVGVDWFALSRLDAGHGKDRHGR